MNLRTSFLISVLLVVTSAGAQPGTTVTGSVTMRRTGDAPVPAVETLPDLPVAAEVAPLPDCRSGKYSISLNEIDKGVLKATGYEHSFRKTTDLVEDPVAGFNACHAAIRWNNNRPEIEVTQCAYQFAPKVAGACLVNDRRVRFVELTSTQTGLIASPKGMVMDFERADDTHWAVISAALPGNHRATVREGQVAR